VEKYTALLTEAVDDGRLTYEEAAALTRRGVLGRPCLLPGGLGGIDLSLTATSAPFLSA
jgi:hypothetical protein